MELDKTVNLKVSVWKKLHLMKIELQERGLSEVVQMLIEQYEKEKDK